MNVIHAPVQETEKTFDLRPTQQTAEKTFTVSSFALLLTLSVTVVSGIFFLGPLLFLTVVAGLMTLLYLEGFLFKSHVTADSLNQALVKFTPDELMAVKGTPLPKISILVPLFHEAVMLRPHPETGIPPLIGSLSQLDYPIDRLEIFLILEKNDSETIAAVEALDLPNHYTILIKERTRPQTKPHACNVALRYVTGDYVGIFDAEDHPESDQLLKVVAGFRKMPPQVVCLQAKLEFFNPTTNLLTRLFAAEYATNSNLITPGLGKRNKPMPLSGTSNWFITSVLKKVGGWDGFNVTEDCDLGMWLARKGYQVKVIDSVTWEEANSHLGSWLKQRSRWIKGYIQTYLVHMRSPVQLYKDLGWENFCSFQLIVGAVPLMLLINPFFWGMTVLYALTQMSLIRELYPTPVLYVGVFTWTIGNFAFMYYLMTGCMIRKLWGCVFWATLPAVFVYWPLMSLAAWKAAYQLVVKPHYWEKTTHGRVLKEGVSIESPTLAAGNH